MSANWIELNSNWIVGLNKSNLDSFWKWFIFIYELDDLK